MNELSPPNRRVLEDDTFTLDHSNEGAVRGYLILRLRSPATSLAELPVDVARALGSTLSRAAAAIEATTGADRVYCLSFGELDRRLHFHLFPRTRALLEEYWDATGTRDQPVNGPMLFEWARTTRLPRRDGDAAGIDDVCSALRDRLTEN